MLKNLIALIRDFLTTDIWRIRLKKLPQPQHLFVKNLRIILASLQEFKEDNCNLRASALTVYTLLSIVPIIAMAFGIAKGFSFEATLQDKLLERFPAQEEIFQQIFGFANTLLAKTKGGLVAGIGVAILFWTIIKVLGNIEETFNDIWKVKKGRTIIRKFSDYLSLMLICPLLLVISSSATVFVSTQITVLTSKIDLLGNVSFLVEFLLKLLPFVIIWVLFTFLYVFMPNTKIPIVSALYGGILAGTLYQIVQWVYLRFQIGVANYNAIYGSFAALPLFLVWLQLSWKIVLLGAEIAFAHQHAEGYEFKQESASISIAFKRLLSLRVANFIVKTFAAEKQPITFHGIADTLDMPHCILQQILEELLATRILVETLNGDVIGYQPAKEISKITLKYVIDALENRGTRTLPISNSDELSALQDSLKEFGAAVDKTPANKLLKNI